MADVPFVIPPRMSKPARDQWMKNGGPVVAANNWVAPEIKLKGWITARPTPDIEFRDGVAGIKYRLMVARNGMR